MRGVLALALVAGCSIERPAAPVVHVVTAPDQPMLDVYLDGARAWTPLGFDFETVDQGLEECRRDWFVTGEIACQISIGVVREPLLREQTGSDARADRWNRAVLIDADVYDYYELLRASSHEFGHILLDTSRHTAGGVMGGASWLLRGVDYELACEEIGICLDR